MAQVIDQSNDFTVKVTVQTQSVKIADDLFAVRMTRTTDDDVSRQDVVMTHANLELAMANQPYKCIAAYWMTDEERAELVLRAGTIFSRNAQIEKRSVFEYASQDREGGVVRADHYNGTWMNGDGSLIPVGIHFDYTDGMIDNAHYDLTRVLEILSKRDDITWVDQRVKRIPSYNASETRSQYLEFWWTPSLEQYEAYRAVQCWSRHSVVFDQDMLGIREAALTETYFGDE